MTSRFRGADALARALAAAGVQRIFALSGNHVMPVFDAALDAGIELLHTRHEAAAVHMADAWARLTGEVGVAMVTGGPGHANAVSALYTASMAESPVVLLSGHAPHDQLGKGAFQEMRQAEVAAPLTRSSWVCAGPGEVASDLALAFRTAQSRRMGPVHLSLPTDCLEQPAAQQDRRRPEDSHPKPSVLDPADGDAILERLRQAKCPLVLAGPALTSRAGRARLAELEEGTGVPVIAMESPRGIADPSLGAFPEVLAQADCILLLAKRLDFTLKFGAAPAIDAQCAFLQVDPDEVEFHRTRRAVGNRLEVTSVADAYSAVDQLVERAGGEPPVASGWLAEVRAAIAHRPKAWEGAASTEPGRLHPVQALRPLQSILDAHPDSVFVSDGGEFGQWAQACLSAPNRVINGVAGAIGAALPFALAARLAKPGAPVIAAMGDGTFGFHASEIDTAVRCALPFVAIVGNDARWNAEYQIQLREYGPGRAVGTALLPTRYDQVTAGLGGYGERVTKPEELLPAVRRAMDSALPACIDVMIEGVAAPDLRR